MPPSTGAGHINIIEWQLILITWADTRRHPEDIGRGFVEADSEPGGLMRDNSIITAVIDCPIVPF
jgi:hypothetical protein